jgi:predicted ATPase
VKASKILLRWYKSFNVNYRVHSDRRHGVVPRPWNSLLVENGSETDYEFVEIPLEADITTIVGANESGKSHLISAISKVVTGNGIPDDERKTRAFARTDLCHFASVRSKNAEAWPHIGMEFLGVSQPEAEKIAKAVGRRHDFGRDGRFTLIVAPAESVYAYLYADNQPGPTELTEAQLNTLRRVLPTVQFIKSDVAIQDDVPVSDLLSAMGGTGNAVKEYFGFLASQAAARFLSSLSVAANQPVDANVVAQITEIRETLTGTNKAASRPVLEAQLFGDVLGITTDALELLAGLDDSDRSYGEGLIDIWNDEIEKTLNLSHYWQQDDLFRLRMNYKRGVIYFEITDKTGATFTFRERSSGLRYFLSYYIQAKALETASRERNCIILMDEPDSFLSIIGQRNLLAVFESMVSADTSRENSQLVYTTHSPFLINRNFPRRIRLVQKGDAEEGTQFVDESRLRRYEPVRSALGIDCSQTLFMGATNVVLEGPTDQFLLSELVRAFVQPDSVSAFLDLNGVTLVSADSAPGVPKLLSASRWGDERNPATVVVLDDDDEGKRQRTIIIEPTEEKTTISRIKQKRQRLLESNFVVLISDLLGSQIEGHKIVTTEDILPRTLYARAVKDYFATWHPAAYSKMRAEVDGKLDDTSFGANGLVADTKAIANSAIHPDRDCFDKMGVLQEAVRIIRDSNTSADDVPELKDLEARFRKFCEGLRRVIELSEQAERRETGKQAIVRVIREFFIRHRESATVYDMERLIVRLESEAELLGEDGTSLGASLRGLKEDARKLRAADQERLTGDDWYRWQGWIAAIRKDPLNVDLRSRQKSKDEAGVPTEEGPSSPPHSQPLPSVDTVTPAATGSAGNGQSKNAECDQD